MAKRFRFIVSVTAVLGLMFLFMACGGSSGGGSSVTYSGSTDPAVADSTTATTLAEYGIGSLEAGFPLVTPFMTSPSGGVPAALSVQPLEAYDFTTTVIIPVPSGAILSGADYSEFGTGTATLGGTLTLLVGNSNSEMANTWYVINAELDGSIDFDGFRTEEGPAITGTATLPYASFYFDGPAEFSVSDDNFTDIPDNPGMIIWQEVDMTFTNLTVSEGSESWSLGEGDWHMELSPGSSVSLDIYSQTVKYEGSTYKLEDTNLNVQFGIPAPRRLEVVQLLVEPDVTTFQISGIGAGKGTFYHPELGVVYFNGNLYEEDPPGDLTGGSLSFYNDPDEGTWLFDVFFGYDELYEPGGATIYNVYIPGEPFYLEKGYIIDGVWTQDDNAPDIAG